MLLSRVTRDEVLEEENQLNGGFEVLNYCHSTKTALCNEVYVVCTYLSYHLLNIFEWTSKGNASLSFLNA